jgi:hypothetical protein
MKSKILRTALIVLAILTVDYALYTWNKHVQHSNEVKQEVKVLQDSIQVLQVRDSVLTARIDSLQSRIVLTSDSIKAFKISLKSNIKKYEKIFNSMFSWTTDKHILFFSIKTGSFE